MEFEWDEAKSASNKIKHGIDFNEAKILWTDVNRLEVPLQYVDELRFVTIGTINNKHWSAVLTYRNNNVRLISVRRSRKEEIELYESNRF